jgi:hypothetical protein
MVLPAKTRFPKWRRWLAVGLYICALTVCVVARGSDPVALALYRPTLPLSAFGFGAASEVFGWLAIGVGALLNGFVLFVIGLILDQRAIPENGAA